MVKTDPILRCYPSGRKVNLLHPTLDQIHISDIAHHLSLLPRYLGGTATAYNNAQHSWFISSQVRKGFELAALLHDAAEAYTGDLPGQLKHLPGMEFYRDVQYGLTNIIMKKFGVAWTDEVDAFIHKLEKSLFPWEEYIVGRDYLPDWERFPDMRKPWSSEVSERRFLARFRQFYRNDSEFA